MSVWALGAERIRRAVVDIEARQDLDLIVGADSELREQLLGPVTPGDVGWLAPAEWLWFSEWRTRWRAPLDPGLVDHLGRVVVADRFAQHRLRRLVMTDPETVELAFVADPEGAFGVRWLDRDGREAARQRATALGLAVDALQVGSMASWWSLRVLVSAEQGERPAATFLQRFAEQRQVDPEVTRRWFG